MTRLTRLLAIAAFAALGAVGAPLMPLAPMAEAQQVNPTAESVTVDKLFDKTAEISAEVSADKLVNLKISLFDYDRNEITSDLYAKVIKSVSKDPAVFHVSMTSIPPSAGSFLESITGESVKA